MRNACCFKGPYQCHYSTSLSFVYIGHIGYREPNHFSPKTCIYEIVVFAFSIFKKRYRKYLKMCDNIIKKNICVQICHHANVQARKAALGRNYFSKRNNFCLNGSQLLSLLLSISVQINAEVLFRRVNYLYLTTFTYS